MHSILTAKHAAHIKCMYCRPRPTRMHEQDDPGRTRTCNPRLRRPMPYPLGHGANDGRDLNSPTLTDSQQACACVPACLRARARARDNLSEPTRGHRHPCCAQRLSTYGSCNSPRNTDETVLLGVQHTHTQHVCVAVLGRARRGYTTR